MRKITTKHDLQIPGYGFIPEGTAFKVDHYNKRFVYVILGNGVILQLARKADCNVIY